MIGEHRMKSESNVPLRNDLRNHSGSLLDPALKKRLKMCGFDAIQGHRGDS